METPDQKMSYKQGLCLCHSKMDFKPVSPETSQSGAD